MRHKRHETRLGGAVPQFGGPFDAVVRLDDDPVLGPMQQTKSQVQLAVPAEPPPVVVPVLVKLGEQGDIALAARSPVAQLDLAKMDVELALAYLEQGVGGRCRRTAQRLLLSGSEFWGVSLPPDEGGPSQEDCYDSNAFMLHYFISMGSRCTTVPAPSIATNTSPFELRAMSRTRPAPSSKRSRSTTRLSFN